MLPVFNGLAVERIPGRSIVASFVVSRVMVVMNTLKRLHD